MNCYFLANTKTNFTMRKTDVTFIVEKRSSENDVQ